MGILIAEIINNILIIVKEELDPERQRKRILLSLKKQLDKRHKQEKELSFKISEAAMNDNEIELTKTVVQRQTIVNEIDYLNEAIKKFNEGNNI